MKKIEIVRIIVVGIIAVFLVVAGEQYAYSRQAPAPVVHTAQAKQAQAQAPVKPAPAQTPALVKQVKATSANTTKAPIINKAPEQTKAQTKAPAITPTATQAPAPVIADTYKKVEMIINGIIKINDNRYKLIAIDTKGEGWVFYGDKPYTGLAMVTIKNGKDVTDFQFEGTPIDNSAWINN